VETGVKARIAVIGGGIVGAYAAFFLARAGAEPLLIEQDQIGGQASGHNAGGLNPLHGPGIPGAMQDLALQSLRLHLEHWGAVRELSGIDFRSRFVARLVIALDDAEAEALIARGALYNATPGFAARWLSPAELRRSEPRVTPYAVGGLWTTGNAGVDPKPYTRAVAAAAASLGASVVSDVATGLEHEDGRVTAVVLASGPLPCAGVVVATGPWCAEPAGWLAIELPVSPLKGELLLASSRDGAPAAEITWGGVGVYHAPEGSIWLGGTEEQAGFDASPSDGARERILAGVSRLAPGLGAVEVDRHVAGLRPITPDGLPIVGIAPGWENVCLAVGAGRKGMLLASGLGLAAAELLTQGRTRVAIESCGPNRWGSES
jgi:glycine oxidase